MKIQDKMLCWNCRGVSSGQFLRETKEFQRMYSLVVIVILEPKVIGEIVDKVCKSLDMNHWGRSEAIGFSGGAWMLWNEDLIKVTIKHVQRSFIHASIRSCGNKEWELTAIYASSNSQRRSMTWDKLNEMVVEGPWCLLGDFNCILKPEERNSSSGASPSFASWENWSGLVDMGFSGPIFTWRHGNEVQIRKCARLYRGLCDIKWRKLFQSATIRHLPHSHSDHCLLLLRLEAKDGTY